MAAPLSPQTWLAYTSPDTSENIATDLDLALALFSNEDSLFDASPGEYQSTLIVTDLSDNLPEGKILAKISSSDNLRAPEPPTVAMALAGFVFLGIFMAGRLGRRQKTHGQRRRVRTYLRKMGELLLETARFALQGKTVKGMDASVVSQIKARVPLLPPVEDNSILKVSTGEASVLSVIFVRPKSSVAS